MPVVTYFKIKAKPGERDAVLATFKRWGEERGPSAKGFIRSLLASNQNDPDEFMAGALFDTKENYDANSNHPDTDKWFQELRSHLAGDPEWFDATVEQIIEGQS